jgi:hypothetical protein
MHDPHSSVTNRLDDLRHFVVGLSGKFQRTRLAWDRGSQMPPAHAGPSLAPISSGCSLCAWCGDAIGSRSAGEAHEHNFGICRKCLELELTRLKTRKPIKTAPAGEPDSIPALGMRR